MDRLIETTLWNYLRENCLPQNCEVVYTDDENLFDAGILDSAGIISFVCFIEEGFRLKIPDEDLRPEYFTSVASIAAYIRANTMRTSQVEYDKCLR